MHRPRQGTPASGARRESEPAVLASGLLRSFAEKRETSPSSARKMKKKRRFPRVGSLDGHWGLQFNLLRTPLLGSLFL